ncbi:hypothetical protein ABID12_003438 [Martelella mangrovi]|uniref:Uncharacterized protein n=1 Tax=Martelella mangrovi TaxID=1397477 RepID=A0ABV2IEY5_9HYPH
MLRDAETLLAALSETGKEPTIRFEERKALIDVPGEPGVHYIAGGGPQAMISKGDPGIRATKVRHAAAFLALRRQTGAEPEAPFQRAAADKSTGTAVEASDAGFLNQVRDALENAARFGLSTPSEALADRLFDLALSSRADALPRLSRAVLQVAGQIRRKADKGELGAAPLAVLENIAEAYALATALTSHPDDVQLRGEVRAKLEPLDDRILAGHGLSIWRTDTGARGVTAYFRSLDNGADAAPVIYTITLARAAGQDPGFDPTSAAQSEQVFGHSLAALATSVFRLSGARCSSEGRLSVGNHGSAVKLDQTIAGVISRETDDVAEGRQEEATQKTGLLQDFSSLAALVASAAHPDRQGPIAAFIDVETIGKPWFDPLAQELAIPVCDDKGFWVELTVSGSEQAMLRALEYITLVREQAASSAIAVNVTAAEGNTRLTPLGLLARAPKEESVSDRLATFGRKFIGQKNKSDAIRFDELVLFDILPSNSGSSDSTGDRTVLDQLVEGLQRGGKALVYKRYNGGQNLTDQWIKTAIDDALALAELGGRMADHRRMARLETAGARLDKAGLAPLSDALRRLVNSLEADRPAALLQFVYLASSLRDLTPTLPSLTVHPQNL